MTTKFGVMAQETQGTFEVDMTPGDGLLDGTARMDFTKTWSGGLSGTSRGLMVSAGDPEAGDAGYVGLEVVEGELDGRPGSFVLQQLGAMTGGEPVLVYGIVPGSGTGDLACITGVVDLDVVDGEHRVTVRYELPT